jgi:uncharacterized protein (DUF1697 family)
MSTRKSVQRYVALLRAINVGGHTVKMDALRSIFEKKLGFSNVSTFIASGNVIFESPGAADELERRIEAGLAKALGYEVATFLRTPAELTAIAKHRPFDEATVAASHALYVAFMPSAPNAESRRRLLAMATDNDLLDVHGRELYWLRRSQVLKSPFSGATIEKSAGKPATARNITTIRKLAAL